MADNQWEVPVDLIVTANTPQEAAEKVKAMLESLGGRDTQNNSPVSFADKLTVDGFRIWFDSIEPS